MSHQPAHTYPDTAIDQVLEALRTTEPPTGLEQRIAARLTEAAEARTQAVTSHSAASSFIAVIQTLSRSKGKDPRISLGPAKLYTAAALTIVITLATLTLLHHHPQPNTAQADFHAHSSAARQYFATNSRPTAQDRTATSSLEGSGLQSRHNSLIRTSALATEAIPHPLSPSSQDQDLDQIALAETLAPSHPAPPMPLTAQEHLMLAATRPGQPIQLAELDLAHAPSLRAAAKAREEASISRYVKSLLFPFAVADALSPTTDSQPQEARTPAPQPSN